MVERNPRRYVQVTMKRRTTVIRLEKSNIADYRNERMGVECFWLGSVFERSLNFKPTTEHERVVLMENIIHIH
jgi:hypothetical protein